MVLFEDPPLPCPETLNHAFPSLGLPDTWIVRILTLRLDVPRPAVGNIRTSMCFGRDVL